MEKLGPTQKLNQIRKRRKRNNLGNSPIFVLVQERLSSFLLVSHSQNTPRVEYYRTILGCSYEIPTRLAELSNFLNQWLRISNALTFVATNITDVSSTTLIPQTRREISDSFRRFGDIELGSQFYFLSHF